MPPSYQQERIGKVFKEVREDKQLTMSALANELLVTRQKVNNIERGEFSWDRFFLVCETLEVKPSKVIKRVEEWDEQE